MNAVVDNDVILKCACYGLLSQVIKPITGGTPVGVLAAARFILGRKVQRKQLRGSVDVITSRLDLFFASCLEVEPTAEEVILAAKLESTARAVNADLDPGESQLCAIAILRPVPLFLTGDKRGIEALGQLVSSSVVLQGMKGRIVCLEQLFLAALASTDPAEIRTAVCHEPYVDRALSICFSCSDTTVGTDRLIEGLSSYIQDVRKRAMSLLAF